MLDGVERWNAQGITCRSTRHLDPANPLRHRGRLPALAGVEFCLQAAAVHGGLLCGGAQPAGYIASLRAVTLKVERLDDVSIPVLMAEAVREGQEAFGMSYGLQLRTAAGRLLLTARATIKLPG